MLNFERQRSSSDFNSASLALIEPLLTAKQRTRLERIRKNWNFFEGYHWEDYPDIEGVELTLNYCRAFVNKIVSFELGKAFAFRIHQAAEGVPVTTDGRTLFEYLEDVWEDNNQYDFCTEMGQMKSVTGEAWVQISYVSAEDLYDPFGKYPDGRLKITLMPSDTIIAEYDPHDRKRLVKLTVAYTYTKTDERNGILRSRPTQREALYRQVWTDSECAVYDDTNEPVITPNRYGVIPFVCITNVTIACRTEGYSDLDDIIPINTEYNLKNSDLSEILDYHAAPITVVYGAKIGNLEKGANKMWGGLSKDARVENLEMKGDMASSSEFIAELKQAMCEVGGVPETVLGGAKGISNTSGVALQYMNLPLIEKCNMKKQKTEDGLERINSMIMLVSAFEGLAFKPDSMKPEDFFFTDVDIPDTLPKDELIELQRLQLELKMGLESRRGAMRRTNKENIEELIREIDDDVQKYPYFYGLAPAVSEEESQKEINSGVTNGDTPIETVRKEITGSNGMST